MEFRVLVGDGEKETGSAQGDVAMWHIMTEALRWYKGEITDDAEAKRRIFAAVREARAAHLTHVAPAGLC